MNACRRQFRWNRALPLAALAWSLGLLAGCTSGPDLAELESFLQTARTPVEVESYRVMPPDVLSISARPTDEYQGLNVTVGPDGKAYLPLLGETVLANRTLGEISAELTERLQDYYKDVEVTVTVAQYRSQWFFVFGEVSRPGAYPYTGGESVLSALAHAQPTRLAEPQKVQLIRGQGVREGGFLPAVDEMGQVVPDARTLTIDMEQLVQHGDLSANVMLARNDVIYVPANPFAKVGLAIQTFLFPAQSTVQAIEVPGDIRYTPMP